MASKKIQPKNPESKETAKTQEAGAADRKTMTKVSRRKTMTKAH
jgi:hypothetical protein